MRQALMLFVLLVGCSTTPSELRRPIGDGSSGDNGHGQPSTCVQRSSVSISATPLVLDFPTPTTVSWLASYPEDCPYLNAQLYADVDDAYLNGQAVGPSGQRTFVPAGITTFSIVVGDTNGASSLTLSASVMVVANVRDPFLINTATVDPVNVLIGVLTRSPNKTQVVQLCDDTLTLDFAYRRRIAIPSHRTLMAPPGCERSLRRQGPLLMTSFKGGGPLFVVGGDAVEISGFRLEGPESGLGTDENGGAKGIQIVPPDCTPDRDTNIVLDSSGHIDCVLGPAGHVEIANMEIFHWDTAGIEVLDTHQLHSALGRLWNTNVGAVHIVNNFIHDNRHTHIGYGVVVSKGAYALIEQNVFNQNRHAIAGDSKDDTGRDFSGYTARDNLILPGGGLQIINGVTNHTHIVDMHGDDSDCFRDHNCGNAGETMIIEQNTVLYTLGAAIGIRGNPEDKAVVDRNVFAHGSQGDAIEQGGNCSYWCWLVGNDITNPIQVTPTNVFGADPMSELGSCHFAGDEVQDQFMASGVTWWVRSGLTGQWRYWNTMSEKVSELQFQDFDGDGICDVLPRLRFPEVIPKKYSKGGTTPWLPVGVIPPKP
jgi:hypothetical protein